MNFVSESFHLQHDLDFVEIEIDSTSSLKNVDEKSYIEIEICDWLLTNTDLHLKKKKGGTCTMAKKAAKKATKKTTKKTTKKK